MSSFRSQDCRADRVKLILEILTNTDSGRITRVCVTFIYHSVRVITQLYSRENTRKHEKTRENTRKYGKTREYVIVTIKTSYHGY